VSIYNAVPLEGVQALVNFMDDFARQRLIEQKNKALKM
jgi:phosphoserine aminotransferase